MILSYDDLIRAWKKIKFNPDITEGQITESSIVLRLEDKIARLIRNPGLTIRPVTSIPTGIFQQSILSTSLRIESRELVLALTMEEITLPANLAAHVPGRSSLARYGLGVHITSPHIHPCWQGRVTLEICNQGPNELEICPGDRVCQIIFLSL